MPGIIKALVLKGKITPRKKASPDLTNPGYRALIVECLDDSSLSALFLDV